MFWGALAAVLLLACPETVSGVLCTAVMGLFLAALCRLPENKRKPYGAGGRNWKMLALGVIVSAYLLYSFWSRWLSGDGARILGSSRLIKVLVLLTGLLLFIGACIFFSRFLFPRFLAADLFSGAAAGRAAVKEDPALAAAAEESPAPAAEGSAAGTTAEAKRVSAGATAEGAFAGTTAAEPAPKAGFPAGTKAEGLSVTTTAAEKLFILVCAAAFVTICSRSSPLYPFNNWDDANCFLTVGKGMMKGLVPYRDLAEQKGPLLYFLYGIACGISPNTFLGGWLLEILAAFVYLLYSFKITALLLRRKRPALIPLIALATYTSIAFVQGGSAEELSLPLLAFSLWLMLKGYYRGKHSPLELILLGLAAGCIFWIKITLVGVYIGWYVWLAVTLLKRRQGRELLRLTGLIALGVLAATLPWILYFGIHGAIGDWLDMNIFKNIFQYPSVTQYENVLMRIPVFGKLFFGLRSFHVKNALVTSLCGLALLRLLLKRREGLSRMLLSIFAGAFVIIYVGGIYYPYYSLPMAVFLAPALSILCSMLPEKGGFRPLPENGAPGASASSGASCSGAVPENGAPAASSFPRKGFPSFPWLVRLLILLGCAGASFLFTPNRYFMQVKQEDMAQFQFRDIIRAEGREDPTLLNYGFLDGGFYTVCDILPSCRSFCRLNLPDQELWDLQKDYFEQGKCDYAVTRDKAEETYGVDLSRYDLIAETMSDDNYGNSLYRLYRLKKTG